LIVTIARAAVNAVREVGKKGDGGGHDRPCQKSIERGRGDRDGLMPPHGSGNSGAGERMGAQVGEGVLRIAIPFHGWIERIRAIRITGLDPAFADEGMIDCRCITRSPSRTGIEAYLSNDIEGRAVANKLHRIIAVEVKGCCLIIAFIFYA